MVILRGGRSTKEQDEIKAKFASMPDDQERLLLAAGRYIGEGFDEARLDTMSWHRPCSGREAS